MTTGRWIIFVAAVSAALALLIFLRRLAANKVAGFMRNIRDQAGLPPDAALSDFNVPVTALDRVRRLLEPVLDRTADVDRAGELGDHRLFSPWSGDRRWYKTQLSIADERFKRHLKRLKAKA